MKRVEIESDLNPFFDATERFLIKFRNHKDVEEFYKKHEHLCGSEYINEMNLYEEYLVEIDLMCEFPNITITNKQEIIERLKRGLEFFENSVL